MKPIAVVPARANSQRLPQKNLRRLGGKELVRWAIEAAQHSGLFGDDIYVTSDDAAIKRIAKQMGVHVLHRHDSGARRDATLDYVMTEVRTQTGHQREPIYLLPPTNPFRNPDTMKKAWAAYALHDDVAKVVSVRSYHDPPHWALTVAGGHVEPVFPDAFARPRHELPTCVQQNGAYVIEGTTRGYTMAFVAPWEECVDINTVEDLEWAEYLLAKGKVGWIANVS